MKSSITDRQLFFLIFLTLTAYTSISLPKLIAQTAGTVGWIALIAVSLVFAVFIAIIIRLNSAFPGMMLFDYSQQITGKFLAYILSIFYMVYFLLVSAYLDFGLTQVLREEFYPKTPEWFMLVVSVLVFGAVAYRGVTSVARFFEIIGTVFVITAVFTHLVMLMQGDIKEAEPFFQASKLKDCIPAAKGVILSFLGIEILTAVPFTGGNARRTTATAVITILAVGLFYVLMVETSIMMLGQKATANYNFALIEAIKLIDIPVLERFDILYLTVGFAGVIAGICGVYMALTEYTVRVFRKLSRLTVVLGIGAVTILLCIAAMQIKNAPDILEDVLLVTGLIAAFVIPVLLYLIAKVRKLGTKPQ